MKIITKTEFAVMVLTPDGTWRPLPRRFGNAVAAQQYLGEYVSDAERHPTVFQAYADYKIAKRTVQTTFTEWEDL